MAALSAIRTQLALITGRRGLASDTTLSDRVINEACRYLEARQDTPQSRRRHFAKPASGVYVIDLTSLRSVVNIWISDGSGRYQLDHIEYDNAKREGLISEVFTAGQPTAYALIPAGRSPAQEASTSSDFTTAEYDADAWGDVKFGSMFEYHRILVLPPTDGSWTFDILGKFWPTTLTDNTDVNWWTINSPSSVAYAAAMILDLERGNSEGAQHWADTAVIGMRNIDIQLVEEEIAPYEDIDDMCMQG